MNQFQQDSNYPISQILEVLSALFQRKHITFPYDFQLEIHYLRDYLNNEYSITKFYSFNSLNRGIDFYNNSNYDSTQKYFLEEVIAAIVSELIVYGNNITKIISTLKNNSQLYSIIKNRSDYYVKAFSILFVNSIAKKDNELFSDIISVYISNKRQDEFLNSRYDAFSNICYYHAKITERSYQQFNDMLVTVENSFSNFDSTIAYERSSFLKEIYDLRSDYEESIPHIVKLLDYMENDIVWDTKKKFPPLIVIGFKYPNGKNGDIFMYFAKQYGEIKQTSAVEYKAYIKPKFKDEIIPLLNYRTQDITISEEVLNLFYPYLLQNIFLKSRYMHTFATYKKIQKRMLAYHNKNINYVDSIYSKLMIQGETSPKWKSEFQLYTIVLELYPDAIYQYRPDWLYPQSLDIFIPSIKTAIEYQGIQHYQSIEHFGGDKALEYNKQRDKKKRQLCDKNHIRLLEWDYHLDISIDNLINMIS